MPLTVEPPSADFPAEGGKSTHSLQNTGELRLAVKVKCSDNSLYRVTPVYSFLGANETRDLEVIRLPGGAAKTDKLVLLYAEADDEHTEPQSVFTVDTVTDSLSMPLNVVAANAAI